MDHSDSPTPMPDDERSITVYHSPPANYRRALLAMFVAMGLLVYLAYDQSKENGEKVSAADARARIAVEQNMELQLSLDRLSRTLERLEEAERKDDEEQRIRQERTVAFIAAVLANSSDPVLREAARQALSDLEGTSAAPSSVPLSPSSPRGAPSTADDGDAAPPSSPQQPPPPSDPSPEPEPPPPSEEPPPELLEEAVDTVQETVDDVCADTPLC